MGEKPGSENTEYAGSHTAASDNENKSSDKSDKPSETSGESTEEPSETSGESTEEPSETSVRNERREH